MPFWQDCIGVSGDCVGQVVPVTAYWLQTESGGGAGSGDGMSDPYSLPNAEDGTTIDRVEGDTLDVVGGTLWYSNGADCQTSGCQMWMEGFPPSVTPYAGSPISGTTEIPFDEFYSQDGEGNWVTPSGDTGRPVGSVDAGIIGNCGADAWSAQDAGTTVSFVVGGASGYDYTSLHDLLNDVFGVGDTIYTYASWFAHIVFRNQRNGEEYHMMAYVDLCF